MPKLQKVAKTENADVLIRHRGISEDQIDSDCRHTREIERDSEVPSVLRQEVRPDKDMKSITRQDGTEIMLDKRERIIINVYRNQQAWKEYHDLPKWKWRCRK